MTTTWDVVKVSFNNWAYALRRSFFPYTTWSDRVKIWFGLIFAQPLSLVTMFADFRLYRLNAFLNSLQRAMHTPCVLPETEEERIWFLRNFVNFLKEEIDARAALMVPSSKVDKWEEELNSVEEEDYQEEEYEEEEDDNDEFVDNDSNFYHPTDQEDKN